MLERLEDQLFAGVISVNDRSRSVTYADATKLLPLIQRLKDEKALCNGQMPSRGRRYSYVPLIKDIF